MKYQPNKKVEVPDNIFRTLAFNPRFIFYSEVCLNLPPSLIPSDILYSSPKLKVCRKYPSKIINSLAYHDKSFRFPCAFIP